MYWDGDRSTYLPAPSNSVEGMNEIKAGDKKGKEKEKKEKVKVAKKIAKVIVVIMVNVRYRLIRSYRVKMFHIPRSKAPSA